MHEINEDRCFITECQKLTHKFIDSGFENQREAKIWVESIFDHEIRPIFELCQPLNPSSITRILETPAHCLRFVSLIPNIAFAQKTDIILDPKVFLSLGYGTAAEHAVLLCSLLLSFSLNAYVIVGTNSKKAT